jgi:biotin carboxylase
MLSILKIKGKIMDRKRILILGGGIMQMPAIRIAKEKGWFVTVADGFSGAPAIPVADRFLHVDLKAWEEMADAAGSIKNSEGLDGVFTAGTDFSVTVARVAEKLGLPGISVQSAIAASDKSIMRRVLSRAGVAVPDFVELTNDEVRPARTLSFPLVVKPVDNMGSRGVRRVDTCDELEKAVKEAFRFSRSGKVLVEEYLDGPEFSIDAIVEHGRITFCGIADRHIFFPPFFVEMGHTIPTVYQSEIIEKVKDEFIRAVKALGIDNGAAKGDVKYCGRKAWIGEIAARLSGGFMSGWTYPLSSGVEPTAGALNIAVGLPAGSLAPSRDHTCAERGFLSIPGIVSELQNVDRVIDNEYIREVFVLVKPGDEVKFPVNNVEKCGNVLASAAKGEIASIAAERGRSDILVRLRAGESVTEAFLFRDREAWIPDAFTFCLSRNLEMVATMSWVYGFSGSRPPDDKLYVAELPLLSMEEGRDWHGLEMKEAYDKVLAATGICSCSPDQESSVNRWILGRLFWHVFIRGGVQGAVWLVDTIRHMMERECCLYRELKAWENE